MSVVFSGTNQGFFTSSGASVIIQLRSDVDWMYVYNYTQIAAASASTGYQFYWQRGMAPGTGLEYESNAGSTAINLVALASGGFTLVNNTINIPGPSVPITAISAGTPPVVTASPAGLIDGVSVVRIYNTVGVQQFGGIDFTVGTIVPSTSFQLKWAPTVAAGTTGSYRVIPYNPYFYPYTRVISKITQAVQAVVTMTVQHAWTVGQRIRFIIPTVTAAAFGMTQLNGVEASIVAVDLVNNTITVDVDTTGFTAFAWPLTTDPVFTYPQVVPVGEDTALALANNVNILGDSEVNQGFIGISLASGVQSPAGQASDVIYWVAGKSVNV